jgi:hypothetical protein
MPTIPKNIPKNESGLADKFHNYIVSKVIDWAISDQSNKGRFSAFKWGPEDQKLLSQIIENPKNAGLNLPIQDSKFKRFFQSIAENGLNTLDVKMFYRYRDRLPLRQLQWEFKKEDFAFTKQKLISKEEIPAGYYMLEVGINTSSFSSQLSFDLNTNGIKKTQVFELKARSHRICKRLIYLESNSKLAANLSEQIQPNNIYHLRLARLTKNFFMSRLMNKIGQEFKIKHHEDVSQDEFEIMWSRYDNIFKKSKNLLSDYQHHIRHVEGRRIPSKEEQLANLARWKLR